jgi:ABC-2 type transport system ATP-binding protein
MRKKVQIISAIIHKPQLLIIDEPTNGLDIEMIIQLKKVIVWLKQEGVTILISTHILDFVENTCNKVALINNGSIQKFFALEELEKNQTLESVFIETIL